MPAQMDMSVKKIPAKSKMLGRKRVPDPPTFEYGPLPAFHLFNQLPTELRLEIWDHVEIEPRVVMINPVFKRKRLRKMVWLRCLTKAPVILHICRESRNYMIDTKRYQQIFASTKWSTWINFDVDIIWTEPLPHIAVDVDKDLISHLHSENRPDLDYFLLRCLDLWVKVNMREIYMYTEHGILRWVGINGTGDPAQIRFSFEKSKRVVEPEPAPKRGFLSRLFRKRAKWYDDPAEIVFS